MLSMLCAPGKTAGNKSAGTLVEAAPNPSENLCLASPDALG